ncbi:MAG: hypothetical protein C3F07_10230 [Anaerolineales bacterium]|nr:hypothetical protein [Anaerolineae bacterium]PWB73222.1 MAG: hypothetical protein C3F07_10230 [Anaerolineales bacterium]
MKTRPLSLFLLTLVLASLACTVFVGGPDYSDRTPIPVSAEAAESLKEEIRRAFEAGASTGEVTIQITEPQITSVLALRLQSDQNLQQDSKPLITDPQVYLRDGQMQIFGKTQQGMFTANIGIVVTVGIDETGKPKIEVSSADFGPFPTPDGIKEAISAMIEEAYTGSLGPVATGLRIQNITIADGIMTVTGRIR